MMVIQQIVFFSTIRVYESACEKVMKKMSNSPDIYIFTHDSGIIRKHELLAFEAEFHTFVVRAALYLRSEIQADAATAKKRRPGCQC